jgi:ribosomal protein S15
MLSLAVIQETIQKWRIHRADKSSVDVQIGLLTEKITVVEKLFKRKVRIDDQYIQMRLTLIKLLWERQLLLKYLKITATTRYRECLKRLRDAS